MGKWLVLRLGQQKYKISLEHLLVSEGKEVLTAEDWSSPPTAQATEGVGKTTESS